MRQYLKLLKEIKEKGTWKPPARQNMPGSISLFGYQLRHNLQDGFPLLTTKKMAWKSIVTELLWFLRGDTNIKYLVDNGCNIWNEDAYNYYKKKVKDKYYSFEEFITIIKSNEEKFLTPNSGGYKLGDCGYQYGKVWRDWEAGTNDGLGNYYPLGQNNQGFIDQIANVIKSLKESPESRRHIVTAIDPAHDKDLALYWCHAMFQFNCRPLTIEQRQEYANRPYESGHPKVPYLMMKGMKNKAAIDFDFMDIPKYYLDCQMYQRSADVVLGVPFNIASYALLIHIIAKICNMIPGEFIHTFGDVHIYDNHKEAVEEQLSREPRPLPKLNVKLHMRDFDIKQFNWWSAEEDFELIDYNPHPAIKAELSTGLKR